MQVERLFYQLEHISGFRAAQEVPIIMEMSAFY